MTTSAARSEGERKKYWVFVTQLPEYMGDMWDEAFSEVLQQLYVKPLPSDTGIFQLDCASAALL